MFTNVLQNKFPSKFRYINRKTAVLESLFDKVAGTLAGIFFDCYLLIQTTFTTTITTTITTIIFAQSYKNLLDAVDVPWKVNNLKRVTQNP